MSLWHLLERAKALYPSAAAAVEGSVRLDWRGLHGSCVRLACALRERGVGPGDRVAIVARNGIAYFCAYYAAAGLASILVPINTRWTSSEIDGALADSGSRHVLVESCFAERVAGCASKLCVIEIEELDFVGADEAPNFAVEAPSAPAQIYYTSGTTGRSKGVVLSHDNVYAHASAVIAELKLSERDVWAHIAPMFHLADAWATFALTAVGATHVFLADFEAAEALACFEREGVTVTNLVPTMLTRMLAHAEANASEYPALRCLMSGGAPIAETLVRSIVETFACEYVQTYGMTETSPYLTMSLLSEAERALPAAEQLARRARTGRAFLGTELRVVDESGDDVARDDTQVGEVQVRGPHVTSGYWNAPEETAAAFTPDGFLKTGDLATIDTASSIRIVDRRKDIILTGGETVYSTEVENRLYEHPAVFEAAVFGVRDEVWGERVTAAIALRPESVVEAEAILAFCRETLAGYKTPKSVHFVEALPRTGSGKISKARLRARFA